MAGPLDGVAPPLVQRFLAMQRAAAAAGFTIGVGSGRRDIARQAQLRIDNGCPDVWTSPASSCRIPTAIPGRSNHNHGLAIDITGSADAKAWVGQNAANFGLHLPVSGEDWHIELIDDEGSRGFVQGAQGAIGFDTSYMDAARNPGDELDERLTGAMDAIVGAQRDALSMAGSPIAMEAMAPVAAEAMNPTVTAPTGPADMAQPMGMETTTVTPGGMPMGQQFSGGVPPAGYVPQGTGVERWRPIAEAALAYTGQDPKWVDLLLRRMAQESGGNPTIINDWDSNAMAGDPSIGLMQNIRSAFPDRAKELAGRGITDGFANMVASIRYTLGRYGSLSAWGKPGGY